MKNSLLKCIAGIWVYVDKDNPISAIRLGYVKPTDPVTFKRDGNVVIVDGDNGRKILRADAVLAVGLVSELSKVRWDQNMEDQTFAELEGKPLKRVLKKGVTYNYKLIPV